MAEGATWALALLWVTEGCFPALGHSPPHKGIQSACKSLSIRLTHLAATRFRLATKQQVREADMTSPSGGLSS